MFGSLRSRIILIVAVLAGAAAFLIVNGLKLGLDLQGGMYLALEVEDVVEEGAELVADGGFLLRHSGMQTGSEGG